MRYTKESKPLQYQCPIISNGTNYLHIYFKYTMVYIDYLYLSVVDSY